MASVEKTIYAATGLDFITILPVILSLLKALGLCNPDKPPTPANQALQAKNYATKHCTDEDNQTFTDSSVKKVSSRVKRNINRKDRKNLDDEYYKQKAIEILTHCYTSSLEALEKEIYDADQKKLT